MIIIKLKEMKLMQERKLGRSITWKEISEETNIPTNTLSRISRLEGYNINMKDLDALCKYFKISPGDLLEQKN